MGHFKVGLDWSFSLLRLGFIFLVLCQVEFFLDLMTVKMWRLWNLLYSYKVYWCFCFTSQLTWFGSKYKLCLLSSSSNFSSVLLSLAGLPAVFPKHSWFKGQWETWQSLYIEDRATVSGFLLIIILFSLFRSFGHPEFYPLALLARKSTFSVSFRYPMECQLQRPSN